MSRTKTGSNAQFTSAGKGLNSIGKHSYAYSGKVVVTNVLKRTIKLSNRKRLYSSDNII